METIVFELLLDTVIPTEDSVVLIGEVIKVYRSTIDFMDSVFLGSQIQLVLDKEKDGNGMAYRLAVLSKYVKTSAVVTIFLDGFKIADIMMDEYSSYDLKENASIGDLTILRKKK